MDNFYLFICGLVVSLVSGFGVIIYAMTPSSYEKPIKKIESDIDLGAVKSKIEFDPPSIQIPSPS